MHLVFRWLATSSFAASELNDREEFLSSRGRDGSVLHSSCRVPLYSILCIIRLYIYICTYVHAYMYVHDIYLYVRVAISRLTVTHPSKKLVPGIPRWRGPRHRLIQAKDRWELLVKASRRFSVRVSALATLVTDGARRYAPHASMYHCRSYSTLAVLCVLQTRTEREPS